MYKHLKDLEANERAQLQAEAPLVFVPFDDRPPGEDRPERVYLQVGEERLQDMLARGLEEYNQVRPA